MPHRIWRFAHLEVAAMTGPRSPEPVTSGARGGPWPREIEAVFTGLEHGQVDGRAVPHDLGLAWPRRMSS